VGLIIFSTAKSELNVYASINMDFLRIRAAPLIRNWRVRRLMPIPFFSLGCISVSMLRLAVATCDANLGDTPEQIKARYGEVTYKFLSGGTFRFRRLGAETDTVDVAFQDGKSQWESYIHWKSKTLSEIDSTGSFSTTDIESVLKANAQGLTWRKQSPHPKDLPGSTTWLLGSNDPKTALAKAASNNEHHSLTLCLMSYDLNAPTDAKTAAALAVLFPSPKETPEPVRVPVPLKPGAFPILKILGQPQSTVSKLLGEPSNHRPIHKPDKLAGGTEIDYPDGTYWTLLTTASYREKLRWIQFFFRKPLPASEDELFKVLELPKSAFRTTSETSDATTYRGVADKRLIEIVASHPTPRDGVGFCHTVDIELIETLDQVCAADSLARVRRQSFPKPYGFNLVDSSARLQSKR
jgi:hypothetical protein